MRSIDGEQHQDGVVRNQDEKVAGGQHAIVAIILLQAIYTVLALGPDWRRHGAAFLLLDLSAAVLAIRFCRRAGPRAALAAGLLFRATLLVRAPDLSQDLRRYVWDGRVSNAGISPYLAPPDSPRLSPLRDDNWRRLEHRGEPTVYPPASQLLFALAGRLPRPDLALKLAFGLADLAVAWLLIRFPGGRAAGALYAAFPLGVFESAGMGHLDSLGVALLVAAVLYLKGNRRAASGAAMGLAVMIKYVPVFLILPFARRGRAALALAFSAVIALFWLVGASPGPSPASGLPNFATRWEANALVYPAVERAVERLGLAPRAKHFFAKWKSNRPDRPWMARVWPFFTPEFFARVILAGMLAVGLVVIAAGIPETAAAVGASVTLLLLLSPVFHPWYALWILPFAALLGSPAMIWLCAAVPLAYGAAGPAPILSPAAALAIEYVPFVVLLPARRRRA